MRRSSRSHRNVDGMNRMQVTANRRLHRSLQRTCSEAFALNPRDGTQGPIIPQGNWAERPPKRSTAPSVKYCRGSAFSLFLAFNQGRD